ncbi:3' terminal RNA ribose 2'-O-methyltransferase Hen1 [Staphylospora marina]|uniref:3' terminal RNA ribose 2'-O-methyltransferase Hen1 n=1 Tax=Staphylospora marina TaxID=2490858 RepID=UPI000F5C2394|nr:3' terminal RNA ribose 2'-O-methyltransferase Hen1 [Staphylospora marina]
MLLTVTYRGTPATDLGFLLHKHPERVQSFPLAYGTAHVFYPEATEERCTAALLLEMDPVGLVRGRRDHGKDGFVLDAYVNDRPVVASSFLSVALSRVFGTAMSGRCESRPDLVTEPLDLEAKVTAVACRGGNGERRIRALFEPLGYEVTVYASPLDERFPDWGSSPYHTLVLHGRVRLKELLSHLYVLLPVLDDEKHYWVGEDELMKLLRHGEEWLKEHPEREWIIRRYLKHQRKLAHAALELINADEQEPDTDSEAEESGEERMEKPMSLNRQRLTAVADALAASGARRVLDLGCGEGKLLRLLVRNRQFTEIVGMDVSASTLEIARERLEKDRHAGFGERVRLLHGSLLYPDSRLKGFDAAALVEVIEHIEPERLSHLEEAVFGRLRPGVLVVTTPNREYNALFGMDEGKMRHPDHRFEWTRAQFEAWARGVAERNGYDVSFAPVGPVDETAGSPTQMAVFRLAQTDGEEGDA